MSTIKPEQAHEQEEAVEPADDTPRSAFDYLFSAFENFSRATNRGGKAGRADSRAANAGGAGREGGRFGRVKDCCVATRRSK